MVDDGAGGRGSGGSNGADGASGESNGADGASGESNGADAMRLEQLRREIDTLDRRIVGLLNERARLGREVGRVKSALGWPGVHDPEREREVLLRVTIANSGPIAQEDLLAIYRRLMAATRALEDRDRNKP
jgi:chorismate mutase